MAAGIIRAPTAAPLPLDEPPGVRPWSQGLRVGPGVAKAKLGGDGFADDRGARLAQRIDDGAVPAGRPAFEDGAAHPHGHVLGFVDVLDADRDAVERRERPPGPVALGRGIGGLAGAVEIEGDERADIGFERFDRLDAALEIGARRVAAVDECGHGFAERQQRDRFRIVRFRRHAIVHRPLPNRSLAAGNAIPAAQPQSASAAAPVPAMRPDTKHSAMLPPDM